MRTIRTVVYILLILPFLFSCEMKKDLFGEKDTDDGNSPLVENAGLLDLEIKADKEAPIPGTKGDADEDGSLNPDDFQIQIIDSLGETVKWYETFALLKEDGDLLLPAGLYTVRASLGTNPNAAFDSPYYSGDTTCLISTKEVSKVVTRCSLRNKKVTFEVTDEFRMQFADDYTIVADNGVGVLTVSSADMKSLYLKDTGVLRFSVYATVRDVQQVHTYSCDLSADTLIRNHNNVYVKLGTLPVNPEEPEEPTDPEEPELPVDPEEPTEPEEPENPDVSVSAPVIKVDVSLIEKDYVIEVPSDFIDSNKPDIPGDGGDGGDSGDSGDGGDDKPTVDNKPAIKGDGFNMDVPVQLTKDNADSKKVRIMIATPGKLASLQVTISSSTGVLEPLLDGLKLGKSFDMCNPTADQRKALEDLGLAIPKKGLTSTVFDISSFMPLIAILDAGDYKFTIKATDEAKQSVSKTLTVHLSK